METVTYQMIRNNRAVNAYIQAGNDALGVLGFTEHGFAHLTKSAENAAYILSTLGAKPREIELARIAGYMHDLGNMVNRIDHAHSGAVIAFRLLDHMGMEPEEIAVIVSAIGNHDESTGRAVNKVSAALILADKSDVRRTRVRSTESPSFLDDIHDRVNYAVKESGLKIDDSHACITLGLDIDTTVCPVMEYFEIFLTRMLMCRRAAEFLGLHFHLDINGTELL